MSNYRVARRYAKSLIDLANERNELQAVHADMTGLDQTIDESRDLQLMLKSPVISADKKGKVMEAVFKGKLSDMVYSFIELLIRKGREAYLRDIIDAFIIIYNDLNKIAPAKLTTAVKLSKETEEKIIEKLKQAGDAETINLETDVDEEIIGGFVLRLGDKMIDASIERKLNLYKEEVSNDSYIKKL